MVYQALIISLLDIVERGIEAMKAAGETVDPAVIAKAQRVRDAAKAAAHAVPAHLDPLPLHHQV